MTRHTSSGRSTCGSTPPGPPRNWCSCCHIASSVVCMCAPHTTTTHIYIYIRCTISLPSSAFIYHTTHSLSHHPRDHTLYVTEELEKALRDKRQHVPAQLTARSQAMWLCVGVLHSFIRVLPVSSTRPCTCIRQPVVGAHITSTDRMYPHAIDD